MSKLNKIIETEVAGGFNKNGETYFICKNPTSGEANDIKNSSSNTAIRGVIYEDGTQYCWDGNFEHNSINNYSKKDGINIDVSNTFRFSCEKNYWIIDLNNEYTFNEGLERVIKYKSELEKYGDVTGNMDIYYASNGVYDWLKDFNIDTLLEDFEIDIHSVMISFENGINGIKPFLREINNIYSEYLITNDSKEDIEVAIKHRLKKIIEAEVVGGFTSYEDTYFIYKNPTSGEINDIENSSQGAIRGVIYEDGTQYCWDGNFLHNSINNYSKKDGIDIDVSNTFRFSYEKGRGWIIDLNRRYTFNEGLERVIKYKSELEKYGDLSFRVNVYYASDSTKDYLREFDKSYLQEDFDITDHPTMLSFQSGIVGIEDLFREINDPRSIYLINNILPSEENVDEENYDAKLTGEINSRLKKVSFHTNSSTDDWIEDRVNVIMKRNPKMNKNMAYGIAWSQFKKSHPNWQPKNK